LCLYRIYFTFLCRKLNFDKSRLFIDIEINIRKLFPQPTKSVIKDSADVFHKIEDSIRFDEGAHKEKFLENFHNHFYSIIE